jgi:hypothetical protein
MRVFDVKAGETTKQSIELRKNQLPLPEYGRISIALTGKIPPGGMIVAWVDPDKEPTKHLLADLRQKKEEFGKWNGKFVMVLPYEALMGSFVKTEASALPQTVTYSFTSGYPVKPDDITVKAGGLKNLPIVFFINEKGIINYLSEGYRIGTCQELLMIMESRQ